MGKRESEVSPEQVGDPDHHPGAHELGAMLANRDAFEPSGEVAGFFQQLEQPVQGGGLETGVVGQAFLVVEAEIPRLVEPAEHAGGQIQADQYGFGDGRQVFVDLDTRDALVAVGVHQQGQQLEARLDNRLQALEGFLEERQLQLGLGKPSGLACITQVRTGQGV